MFQYVSMKYPQDDIYYQGILLKFIPTSEKKKKSANGEEYAYTSDSPQKLFSCSSDIFSIKPDKYFSFVCLLSSECYLNLG